MARILAALDHPERHLPPVIHVAGTNGKGSTVAFMRAILEAAGKRVHVYTSPNLVRLNERFRIGHEDGGKLVGDAELGAALAECEAKNGDAPITVFEIETAAAFLLFSRHPADVLLLEVGLGGRLDATNVVERPLASVITRLSLDHREFLGDTIDKIAAEKAGILKARRAGGRHQPGARGARRHRAAGGAAARRRCRIAGEHWTATEERGRLVYQDRDGLLDLPAPKLYGRHQFENAGAAIAALRVERAETSHRRVRDRHDAGRMAGAHAAAVARPACGFGAAGQRAVARRRPQCRRRPGHCRGARRSRGARVAAARAHRRHVVDQGLRRLSEEFFRAGAARHRGADPSGQGGAGGRTRRGRRQRRHSGAGARRRSKARSRSPASSICSRRRAS